MTTASQLKEIIVCFQSQKQLATLNNIQALLKSLLIDLRARNFMHAKTSLRARCAHARHRARNLASPVKYSFLMVLKSLLKKLRCILQFFLSVKEFDFKYLFLNLDRLMISLCKFFCHKRCLQSYKMPQYISF